jgi:hypothetical protein
MAKTISKKKYTNQEIGALADAFGKSLLTIQRWIDSCDDRLISDKARGVIAKIRNKQ